MSSIEKSSTFTLGDRTVNRLGYGAMQLAGPGVFGSPKDRDAALAVLRAAVARGVNHIDTSDFYGPRVTNQLIKQALHPYPDDLVIVTKVGARRDSDGSWPHALSRQEIIDAVHDNLRNLGLDALDVVNLRLGGLTGPTDEPFEEPLTALTELKQQEHCFSQAASRGAGCYGDCLRPELLQRSPAQRRRICRCARRAGHSLCALFSTRRVLPAAVIQAQ